MSPRTDLLAKTGARRSVDYVLERQPELAGAPLPQAGPIIVYRLMAGISS